MLVVGVSVVAGGLVLRLWLLVICWFVGCFVCVGLYCFFSWMVGCLMNWFSFYC